MKKMLYIVLSVIVVAALIALGVNFIILRREAISKERHKASMLSLYDNAKELESKGSYLEARNIYKELLEKSQIEELTQKIQEDLMRLNMKILFSPVIAEESVLYTVKKGDTLARIAKEFNTTVELIMKSNNLPNELIRIGKKLKLSTAKYSAIVDCSQNTLTLKSNDSILKTYAVSTGINNSTPLGQFKVVNRIKDPVWHKQGAVVPSGSPDNILGSRWLGISVAGYGIHGTDQPETLGKNITAGCVRMSEPDVQELYAVLPIGTEVTIVE